MGTTGTVHDPTLPGRPRCIQKSHVCQHDLAGNDRPRGAPSVSVAAVPIVPVVPIVIPASTATARSSKRRRQPQCRKRPTPHQPVHGETRRSLKVTHCLFRVSTKDPVDRARIKAVSA